MERSWPADSGNISRLEAMKSPDILLAIKPVVDAFDRLSIPYYIGGSIASSAYGIARATMDADIVADLVHAQVASFVAQLRAEYYVDEQTVSRAVSDASSFNLIHLGTMMKIDVFIQRKDPYHKSAMERRLTERLVEDDQDSAFFVSSPEDVILSKLCWYETGGRVSERQWLDILGVIKVQSDSLNREYLIKWSNVLGVFDLLKQAFSDSGVAL
jgi:hypothetical protein